MDSSSPVTSTEWPRTISSTPELLHEFLVREGVDVDETDAHVSMSEVVSVVPPDPFQAVAGVLNTINTNLVNLQNRIDNVGADTVKSEPLVGGGMSSAHDVVLPFERNIKQPFLTNVAGLSIDSPMLRTNFNNMPFSFGTQLKTSVAPISSGMSTSNTNVVYGNIPSTGFSVPSMIMPPISIPPTGNVMDAMQQQINLLSQAVVALTQIMQHAYKPRVVPPTKFCNKLDQHINTFFSQFEQYCHYQYPGSCDQWARLLPNYLEGSYLELYKQLSKKTLDYTIIKSTMVKWCDHEYQRMSERHLQAFNSAVMRKDESVTMFALRLEQLASKAYPGVDMRAHNTLRTAFLKSLPSTIEQRLNDCLIDFDVINGKKVEWDQLVVLADQHMYKIANDMLNKGTSLSGNNYRKELDVEPETVTIDNIRPVLGNSWGGIVQSSAQKLQMNNASIINHHKSPSSKNKELLESCSFCGKKNHQIESCYKFHQICSYCKQKGHFRAQCPEVKYQSAQISSSSDICPFCGKNHLGMYCNNQSSIASNENSGSLKKNYSESSKPQRVKDPSREYKERNNSFPDELGNRLVKPELDLCDYCEDRHARGDCDKRYSLNH